MKAKVIGGQLQKKSDSCWASMVHAHRRKETHREILALLAALAMALLPQMGLASDQKDIAIYRSTSVNLQINILRVAEKSAKREGSIVSGTLYDPTITYPGIYEAKRLYRMSSSSTSWMGSNHPAFLKDVACSDARKEISQDGSWTGLLMKDGSCGMNSEPSEWVIGNRLNYEAGINTTPEP